MMQPMRGALAQPSPQDNSEGAEGQPTEQHTELFDLVVGRTLEALSQDGEGLDSALKANPIRGAVEYGVAALHTVTGAAEKAGSPIPFEVLIGAGMQTIKVLAGIANDKGYLADEDIEGFLKEAFQQSLGKYAQMDMQAGKLDQKALEQMKQIMGESQPEQGDPQQGALPMPEGA